jgi:site-specific recombinase XerD
LALGVVQDLRSPRSLRDAADAGEYQEHLLAEYVFARAAHGVADATVRQDMAAISEFLGAAGVWAWEVEPRHADKFLGEDQRDRAVATRRGKALSIDIFYRFLELRYRGEILRLTDRVVSSPIDAVNRPAHTGDFSVRIPPAASDLEAFFEAWRAELPGARKWLVATRNYTMARVAGDVGLRVRELCGLALDDLHFEHGPMGKIHVRLGKGSRGSGPRERLVPMLGESRRLLTWWVENVRGEFDDDWELPQAVAFPSERDGLVGPESFRAALHRAARAHLPGPVRSLTPHVLRHACASELYRSGVNLYAIQQLLGHRWMTTTMGYVHVSSETVEEEYRKAAERAAAGFKKG